MTNALQQPTRGLVPRVHEEPDGIPYFDEKLGVPQNTAHRIMVSETAPILAAIAVEGGLVFMSDEPIWYLNPENDTQRTYYGDCVLARPTDTRSITAQSLLLAMEVVSTNDRRKEFKDTRFQKLLNEYNGVPEFALLFPDLDDPRALTWCRLVDAQYEEHAVAPGGRVASEAVPGLELRVLPKEAWTSGYKIEIYYRGGLRPRLSAERQRAEQAQERAEQAQERAEQAQERAEQAQERAEQERTRAEQERARADRLAARLRELGIDPER